MKQTPHLLMVGQKDGSMEWWKDRVKTVTPLKLYLHEVVYKQYNHITKQHYENTPIEIY